MKPLSSSEYAAFGRKAASYESYAFVQKEVAQWTAEWLPEKALAANCLEFGAGTGLLSQYLATRFGKVEASDLEAEMLHVCQERIHGVHHSIRDAWAEQDDPAHWDYVVSSSLLQWARDPVTSLSHWRALLKDNGRIVVGFFLEPSLTEMIEVMNEQGPVEWRKSAIWQDIFERSGFEIVRMETKTSRYNYDSAMHFWKSLHATGATVSQRMKPSAMLRFFRDYDAQFKDEYGVYATWTSCRVELKPSV
jgi:malonyl-CoA O-methyltransferase